MFLMFFALISGLAVVVHNNGKAVVFTGSREDAEKHTQAMHAWGLMASFEKAEN